jgi:hypothetical protein
VVCFIQLSEAGVLSASLKMDKIEYRAVIKFFVKEVLPQHVFKFDGESEDGLALAETCRSVQRNKF